MRLATGGSIEAAGIAVAIGLLVKAVLEMPVGMYIDKSPSEKDDLYSIILGSFIMGAAILMYSFITDVWQMYLLQALMGAGAAISYPGWSSMFTKHIDKNREAFEWSLYDVFLGIGMAGAAAIGGFVANQYGFNMIFYIAAAATFFGATMLFMLRKEIR